MTHSPRTTTEALFDHWSRLLDEPDGGFTVALNWTLGKTPESGYAVSEYPELSLPFNGTVHSSDIQEYVIKNNSVLLDPGNYLGGWRDPETGVAYLDVVHVFKGRNEALDAARACGELAVWDFAEAKSIRVL
jgi:hypothetical protein